jgi:hypothetical protein
MLFLQVQLEQVHFKYGVQTNVIKQKFNSRDRIGDQMSKYVVQLV